MSRSKILFILSGSIAAYKACQVVSHLVQDGNEVRTVATPSALNFIGAATLEGLTGQPVQSDLWQNGHAMDHIHLSRWADFGILCPASANTLNRAAAGLGEDLVGNLLLGWPSGKPLHIFPAMNSEMLVNAITRENIARLSKRGFTVHETHSGNLACGEKGAGRLLEPDEILRMLKPIRHGSILITAGATREPIDGIRFLSNVSTGQTGARLAEELSARGWETTYVHGVGAALPRVKAKTLSYGSFQDLNETLRAELQSTAYSAVVHAAAVADYSVCSVRGQPADTGFKLKSDEELNLKLKPNFKILPRLKEYSCEKSIKVIGFKLTLNAPQEDNLSIARGLLGETVDAVVANDWASVRADRAAHPGHFVTGDLVTPFSELGVLSELIHQLLSGGKIHGP